MAHSGDGCHGKRSLGMTAPLGSATWPRSVPVGLVRRHGESVAQKKNRTVRQRNKQSLQNFSSDVQYFSCLSSFGQSGVITAGLLRPRPLSAATTQFQLEESMAWLALAEACSIGSTPATTVMAVADAGVWPRLRPQ